MATFASKSNATGEESSEADKPVVDSRKIDVNNASGLLNLRNELLKKKREVAGGGAPTFKKTSSILKMRKEEKEREETESRDRKRKIAGHESALKKEEEERVFAAMKKLKEKAELYDHLTETGTLPKGSDQQPLPLMVDFQMKKKQEDEAPSTSTTPLVEHYRPDEERRQYGVSHMVFSLDEEKRQQEMEELREMSRQTDAARQTNQIAAAKRKTMERSRVAAMRARMGLPPLKEATPEPEAEETNEPVDLETIPVPEKKETVEERLARVAATNREWDRGKGRYNTWLQQQRDRREEDFRPPEFY